MDLDKICSAAPILRESDEYGGTFSGGRDQDIKKKKQTNILPIKSNHHITIGGQTFTNQKVTWKHLTADNYASKEKLLQLSTASQIHLVLFRWGKRPIPFRVCWSWMVVFYLRGMNEGKNPKGVGTNDGQSSSTSSSLLKEIGWIQVGVAHFESSNATYPVYLQHALGIWWPKRTGRCLYFPVSVVSGSNMTLVLIENDIPLGGSRNKIEDNQVSSTVTKSNLHPIITLQYSVFLLGWDSQNTLSAWRREESWPITSASCAQVTALYEVLTKSTLGCCPSYSKIM